MTSQSLGRLEKVELREAWATEAGDFTPWLGTEENIALLGDTIGLDLEVEAQERQVGPFRADILCKDTANGSWVLIENQLERTDHTHLGQLLTYASGLDAVTIVWIAQRFTDEHRSTLDWLNHITDNEFSFFGLEVELWKIGSSKVAPKFNVVSKPNEWTKTVARAAGGLGSSELTETKKLQLEYWTALRKLMEEADGRVKPTKPLPQHWQSFAVGRSYFHLNAFANTREKRIGIQLIISGPNGQEHYSLLEADRREIEAEMGEELEWRPMKDKKESHVNLKQHDSDPNDRSSWPAQHDWIYEKLQSFDRVFRDRIRGLDASDWDPEGEED